MANWVEPIFDRTEADVVFAKEQIRLWIEQVLTGNPIETYALKGCLNVRDINRIEGNIQYLGDRLKDLYYISGVSCKTWTQSGLPTEHDVQRIISNINLMIAAYYRQTGTPSVPNSMRTYTDINNIEENLLRLKQLLDHMEKCFQKSGTFQCGAKRMLPIRR